MTYLHQRDKQLYHPSHRLDTSGTEPQQQQQPQQQVRQETTTTTVSSTTTTTSSNVPLTSDSEPTMYNSTSGRHTHRASAQAGGPTASSKSYLHSLKDSGANGRQQQSRYLGDSPESLNGGVNGNLSAGSSHASSTNAPPPHGSRQKTHSTSSASSTSSSNSGHHHSQGDRQRAAAEAHDNSGGIHSWPILFAIIPPLGALVFGKSDIWSDVLTLALIAFFLYNIIKVPWELYYAARTRRVLLSAVTSNIGIIQDPVLEKRRQTAATSLRRQEFFSLLLVLASPFLGGYTLQYLKTFFSSYENYLSALNIELFIIASAIRPLTHLVSLLKARALHLQEQVHYPSTEVELLKRRMATIEAELTQLRRAFATKREVLQVQDTFEPTIHQLTKQIKRQDKRENLLRSYTEERFAHVEEKLREYETILAYRLTEEQHRASLLFLPLNILVAMLGYFTYFLPARLTGSHHHKQQPMLASAPVPQAIGDGRATTESSNLASGRDRDRGRDLRDVPSGMATSATHPQYLNRTAAHMLHRTPY